MSDSVHRPDSSPIVYRWSPCQQATYRVRIISGTVAGHMALGSVQAWNLAWLTHDFERNARLPYDAFVRDVRATLEETVTDAASFGGMFRAMAEPTRVSDLTTQPVGLAARRLAAAVQAGADWPLVRRYGPDIAQTWLSRAQLARINHPQSLIWMTEHPARNTAAAQTLWTFLRDSWTRQS